MASLLPTPEPPDPVEGALGHFEHTNWVKQALKNLDQGTVHAAAGSAGSLVVDDLVIDNSADQQATLRLRGNSWKVIRGERTDGKARWQINLGDATAEGGANSGSNFSLLAFQDDGVAARTAITIVRDTGLMHIAGPPTSDTGAATKKYVDDSMPIGVILAYGGSSAPAGWLICNGLAIPAQYTTLIGRVGPNTPNLTDRFIIGGGGTRALKATGGAERVTLSGQESGAAPHIHAASAGAVNLNHNHDGWTGDAGTHSHGDWTAAMDRMAAHGHTAGWTEGSPNANDDGDVIDSTGPSQGYVRWSLHVQSTNTNHLHQIYADGNHSHGVGIGYRDLSHTHTIAVTNNAPTSASQSHENMPPYYVMLYIIKAV